jgi:hypothetical protein
MGRVCQRAHVDKKLRLSDGVAVDHEVGVFKIGSDEADRLN